MLLMGEHGDRERIHKKPKSRILSTSRNPILFTTYVIAIGDLVKDLEQHLSIFSAEPSVLLHLSNLSISL